MKQQSRTAGARARSGHHYNFTTAAITGSSALLPLASMGSDQWPVDNFPTVGGLTSPVSLVRGHWWTFLQSRHVLRLTRPQNNKIVEATHKFVLSRTQSLMRKLMVNPMKTPIPHKPQVGNKHVYSRMQSLLPDEYKILESHRFRDPYDIQFGYALAGFTLNAKHPSLHSLAQSLFGAHDTDCNGVLVGAEVEALLKDLFTPRSLPSYVIPAARERVARWPFKAPLTPPLCRTPKEAALGRAMRMRARNLALASAKSSGNGNGSGTGNANDDSRSLGPNIGTSDRSATVTSADVEAMLRPWDLACVVKGTAPATDADAGADDDASDSPPTSAGSSANSDSPSASASASARVVGTGSSARASVWHTMLSTVATLPGSTPETPLVVGHLAQDPLLQAMMRDAPWRDFAPGPSAGSVKLSAAALRAGIAAASGAGASGAPAVIGTGRGIYANLDTSATLATTNTASATANGDTTAANSNGAAHADTGNIGAAANIDPGTSQFKPQSTDSSSFTTTASESDGSASAVPVMTFVQLMEWSLARAVMQQIQLPYRPMYHAHTPLRGSSVAYMGISDDSLNDLYGLFNKVETMFTADPRQRAFACLNDAIQGDVPHNYGDMMKFTFEKAFPTPAPWEKRGLPKRPPPVMPSKPLADDVVAVATDTAVPGGDIAPVDANAVTGGASAPVDSSTVTAAADTRESTSVDDTSASTGTSGTLVVDATTASADSDAPVDTSATVDTASAASGSTNSASDGKSAVDAESSESSVVASGSDADANANADANADNDPRSDSTSDSNAGNDADGNGANNDAVAETDAIAGSDVNAQSDSASVTGDGENNTDGGDDGNGDNKDDEKGGDGDGDDSDSRENTEETTEQADNTDGVLPPIADLPRSVTIDADADSKLPAPDRGANDASAGDRASTDGGITVSDAVPPSVDPNFTPDPSDTATAPTLSGRN